MANSCTMVASTPAVSTACLSFLSARSAVACVMQLGVLVLMLSSGQYEADIKCNSHIVGCLCHLRRQPPGSYEPMWSAFRLVQLNQGTSSHSCRSMPHSKEVAH